MSDNSTRGRLMEHMVFQRTRAQSLADVKALNMWGYDLENVSICSKMTNAETLAFPLNRIATLAPFSSCKNLRNLLLRENQIADFEELDHLQGLRQLTTLSLRDNPINSHPNYREIVMQKLPQLTKLDEIDCSRNSPVQQRASISGMSNGAQSGRVALKPRAMSKPPAVERKTEQPSPAQTADKSMLAAILSLIPELSQDSLRIVLEAVQARTI
jgi:Leucine-rich repeat (LRR) protein